MFLNQSTGRSGDRQTRTYIQPVYRYRGHRNSQDVQGRGLDKAEEEESAMLMSRHRIGEHMPRVVHQGPDPSALAVCREVLDETGAECVILHGSRGWGGWDEQSNLDLVVIHHDAVSDKGELEARVERAKERHYRDSLEDQLNLDDGTELVTPERYDAWRRTLNDHIARAARHGRIFPKEPGTEERYRHGGDTSNEWELVTRERLRGAVERSRGIESLQRLYRERPDIHDSHHCRLCVHTIEGRNAHMLLWLSGAALLSILGVVYPMRSAAEMARLIPEHDAGWDHEFQSDLDRTDQYAECGCELVVTDPIRNLPELWRTLEIDRDALWQRILELSGYDLFQIGKPSE
jgi:predicted nucleotidyltransferase